MSEHLTEQAPEYTQAKSISEVEVTEIHSTDAVEVNRPNFDVSSDEYHIPTMKALGKVAVKTK